MGPHFSPHVLTETRRGNGRGWGLGQGTLKKHVLPQAVQQAGWAIGPGARVFRGHGGPVLNTIWNQSVDILLDSGLLQGRWTDSDALCGRLLAMAPDSQLYKVLPRRPSFIKLQY